jgi:hypothetical protein
LYFVRPAATICSRKAAARCCSPFANIVSASNTSRSDGFVASKYIPWPSTTQESGWIRSAPSPTERRNPSSIRTTEMPRPNASGTARMPQTASTAPSGTCSVRETKRTSLSAKHKRSDLRFQREKSSAWTTGTDIAPII